MFFSASVALNVISVGPWTSWRTGLDQLVTSRVLVCADMSASSTCAATVPRSPEYSSHPPRVLNLLIVLTGIAVHVDTGHAADHPQKTVVAVPFDVNLNGASHAHVDHDPADVIVVADDPCFFQRVEQLLVMPVQPLWSFRCFFAHQSISDTWTR